MSELSPRLELPFIQPSQAQKHVTHNEAIEVLDAVVQMRLESIDQNDPPTSATDGQAWHVSSTPTGAWTGHAGSIASWRNNGWLFLQPSDGWIAWISSFAQFFVFQTGQWIPLTTETDLDNVDGVGINTTSDSANPLSVAGPGTLLSHDGAGHQLKLNKASGPDTASLLFQTGFSGRAELGLSGSDTLSIKVSADGSLWTDVTSFFEDRVMQHNPMHFEPQAEPVSPIAGDVYFDSSSGKLRCFDGSIWNDLF